MLKHIVVANFKAEVSQHDRDEFAKKVPEILAQIPETKNVFVAQASEVEGKPRYAVALFIDFDSEAALKSYLENPIHKAAEAQMPSMFSEFLVSDYLY
jgi:quinol monooxygenase YgiN